MAAVTPQVLDSSALQSIASAMPDVVSSTAKAYTLKDMMDTSQMNTLQLNAEKRKMQEQETARNILKNSDLSNVAGAYQAAEKLTKAGLPKEGMEIVNNVQNITSGRYGLEQKQLEIHTDTQALVNSTVGSVVSSVAQMADAKKPDGTPVYERAIVDQAANTAFTQAIQNIKNDENLPPDVKKMALAEAARYVQSGQPITYENLQKLYGTTQQGLSALKAKQERDLATAQLSHTEAETGLAKARTANVKAGGESNVLGATKGTSEYAVREQIIGELAGRGIAFPRGKGVLGPYITGLIQANPGLTPAEIADKVATGSAERAGMAATIKAFDSGQQGNSVKSFNVGLSHLDTLDELATALQNKDLKVINRIGNAWAAETGQSAPTSFDAARNIVGDEIVKAVTGSAGALGDREAAAATISKINSPQSLKDVIKTYKTLMVGQLTGLKQQFVSAGGKPESFDAKLSPETKKFLATEKRTPATTPPATNSRGWTLHQDAKGNYGYVSPDGKQVEAVPSGR